MTSVGVALLGLAPTVDSKWASTVAAVETLVVDNAELADVVGAFMGVMYQLTTWIGLLVVVVLMWSVNEQDADRQQPGVGADV
jgi:hypothetical protein